MKKSEIKVGCHYIAKVGANLTTVRVDDIREVRKFRGSNPYSGQSEYADATVYDVTNVKTKRKTTFQSAAKFRSVAPGYGAQNAKTETITPVKAAALVAFPGEGIEEAMERVESVDTPATKTEGKQCSDPTQQPERIPILSILRTFSELPTTTTPNVLPIPSNPQPVQDLGTNHVDVAIAPPIAVTPVTPSSKPASPFASVVSRIASGDSSPHIQLKAFAGSGKTPSAIEGLKFCKKLPTLITPSEQQLAFWEALGVGSCASVRLSAFNSTITDEMKERVKASGLDVRGVEAVGVHSLGRRSVTKAFGRIEPDKWTVSNIASQLLGGEYHTIKHKPGIPETVSAIDELVSLCKQNLMDASEDTLDGFVSHYDIELGPNRARVFELVPQVLEKCRVPENGVMAFDDMIWLPLIHNLPIAKVDLQVGDEAQDFNRMQQELLYLAGHRLAIIGDPNQAIYGFAGADSESMPRMVAKLKETRRGCIELPLTVTRRCGKAIVNEARKIVPTFEAHESNQDGVVRNERYPVRKNPFTGNMEELPWDDTYLRLVREGSMVVCRVNAPLVSQCFRLLKAGIRVNIIGRDIGTGLIATINKFKTTTTTELSLAADNWADNEVTAERQRKKPSDTRIITVQDKRDCIKAFAEGLMYTTEVIEKIKSVFTDKKDLPGVRLCTIHKAKGLESEQVFFLRPPGGECPHPGARSDWQRKQERNLEYVAITRAISELVYVY